MPGASVFGPGPTGPGKAAAHHPAPTFSPPPGATPLDWNSILDQLPYGLVVLGPEQQVRHENAACRRLLGFSVVERGGIEGWLEAVCPDQAHREKVINSWREHIWRNQLTRTFTLKTAEQKLKEIEFRSSLLQDGGITLTIEDVTEARRVEETLRHGKLKFRALFSHSATGTVLVDRTGRIIDANPSFVSLTGISLKNLRLSTLSELLHPNEAADLARAEDELIRHSAPSPGEKSVSRDLWLRTSASEKRCRVTYCPIGESAGRPAMAIYLFSAVTADVSNEKLAARLRSVAQKAQALLHAVPDLILLINSDGAIADFAPPPKPWKELAPDETWLQKPAEAVWPVFGNLLKQCQGRISAEGKTIHAEIRGPGSEGFEFAVTFSPSGEGQILAVVRNQSEVRILRHRDFWQSAAFSGNPMPMVMVDEQGIVTRANPSAHDLLGLQHDTLTGRRFSDFYDGGEASFRAAIASTSPSAGRFSCDTPMILPGGKRLRARSEFLSLAREGAPHGTLIFLDRSIQRGSSAVAPPSVPNQRRQHGFRNQLQLVTSLFSLEPQGLAARDAFIRWQIRLRAMAQACPDDDTTIIRVVPLLRSLADEICSLLGRGPGRREVVCTGNEELTIDTNTATPFSLLIGEIMRLVLASRQPGPGPELYLNLRSETGGGFQLTVRPGTNRSFVFTDRTSEVETLELLTEQIRGRLEVTDRDNPSREWILIVPPGIN